MKSNKNKNALIVKFLDELASVTGEVESWEEIHNKSKYLNKNYDDVIDKYIRELSTVIGIYLKLEWEVVKKL